MTDAVVRMVRDTLARVRHLSPDAVRQESRALVDRLPFADRVVLRLWAVAILRCLPPPPDPTTNRPPGVPHA